MTATPSSKPIRRWSRAGSVMSMLVLGGFVCLSLWARFNPVGAAQAPGEKKGAKAKAPAAKGKDQAKVKTPAPSLNIPGAGKKLDAQALTRIIDSEINKRLQAEGIKASPKSDDAEFLRRVYLDLVGVIPTPEKVQEFLKSTDPKKREKVIDELLADPRFGKQLAEMWSGLMIPRESNNRRLDHTPMQQWLAQQFNDNVPLNKLVYDLVTASGNQDENGAVTFFVGNPTVDKMTDNVARMFLGVQLQCAQCHNHPFVDWKQDEYWAMAQFFFKTRLTVNPQQAAKKGVKPGIQEAALPKAGKKGGNLPESAKFVAAKFLQGDKPALNDKEPYRPVLAKWMTSPENPFFARAMVNRFWYQLFGRGLVNPVDDMHEENAPSHPELLAALTEQLKANGFDLKYLMRAICNSEAYQRTSRPVADNQSDTQLYSHRVLRVLSAEQLYDSLVTVLGTGTGKKGDAPKTKGKGPAITPRENFLSFFRIDEGVDPLEYQSGIPQALRLMNASQFNATNAAVGKAMTEGGKDASKVIEHLYLQAVSRPPTAQETQRLLQVVNKAADPRTAYGDILWALINSSEFALNH